MTAKKKNGKSKKGHDGLEVVETEVAAPPPVVDLSATDLNESSDEPEEELGPDVFDAADQKPESVSRDHLRSIIESLVFVSDRPATPKELARMVRSKKDDVLPLLREIQELYRGRGIELQEVGGGFQFRTAAANAPFVRDYVEQRPVRLTRAQLETLAIVAYRQPVTRPEIDDIRGVDSGSAMKVLLDRGLLKILGKKEEAGRPIIYGTTPLFLEFFGMNTLGDLPTLKEFTDLSDESRALFERRSGEPLGDLKQANAEAAAVGAGAAAVAASWDDDATEVGDRVEANHDDTTVSVEAPPDPGDDEEEEEALAAADEDAEEVDDDADDDDDSDDDDDDDSDDDDDDDSDDDDDDSDDDDDDSDDDDDDADDDDEDDEDDDE